MLRALRLAALAVAVAQAPLAGQSPTPQATGDLGAVRDLAQSLAEAFNAGDGEAMGRHFWQGGRFQWVYPKPDQLVGSKEITEVYRQLFALPSGAEARVEHQPGTVTVSGRTAVLRGTYAVSGLWTQSGQVCYVAMAEKKGTDWKLSQIWAVHPCGPAAPRPGSDGLN